MITDPIPSTLPAIDAELAELEAELARRSLLTAMPVKFQPLLDPARYKGAYGGRGSGKSHFFAEYLLKRCLQSTVRAVCVREVQRSLEQSVKRLLEDKIEEYRLTAT